MPPHVDADQRAATVARLHALREAGLLSPTHIRIAAEGLGISVRSVQRWIAPGAAAKSGRPGPEVFELSDTDREAFAFFRGNIAAVFRARAAAIAGDEVAAGVPIPQFLRAGWVGAPAVSARTLRRIFATSLTPAELALWRGGEEGFREHQVYLKRPEERRGAVWEMDHKNLPILVLPPRGPAVTPWLTTIIDDGTRALVGWAISLYPHTGTVFTAIRMALVHDPARGPFGAVPVTYRIDGGLDFAAAAVKNAMSALVVSGRQLPEYTPHRKGKVERIHRTIDDTLLKGLPGFTEGPRDASGKLLGPLSDSVADRAAAPAAKVQPMRIERFAACFTSWVHWYNHERPHSMIGDRTPAQAWAEDPSALARIDADKLRHLLLADVERTIAKDGIRFHSLSYIAPEIRGRKGQIVQVRYMPHDDRFIEVYLDGKHLCTAVPSDRMTAAQTEAWREHQRAEAKRLGAEKRRATRRAKTVLAPLTGEQTAAEETKLVPVRKATPAGPNYEAMRAKASASLLGLHPPRAIPAKES